jgi:small subunit ribosomal protein S8
MSTNDPISDMLTRMRNAILVNKEEVVLPYSKLKYEIANIMKNEGVIDDVKNLSFNIKKDKSEAGLYDGLKIKFKFVNKKNKINALKRISKPGKRIYVKKDEIYPVLNNYGFSIISTSRGLMTNKEAKKLGIGGEIMCEIY